MRATMMRVLSCRTRPRKLWQQKPRPAKLLLQLKVNTWQVHLIFGVILHTQNQLCSQLWAFVRCALVSTCTLLVPGIEKADASQRGVECHCAFICRPKACSCLLCDMNITQKHEEYSHAVLTCHPHLGVLNYVIDCLNFMNI